MHGTSEPSCRALVRIALSHIADIIALSRRWSLWVSAGHVLAVLHLSSCWRRVCGVPKCTLACSLMPKIQVGCNDPASLASCPPSNSVVFLHLRWILQLVVYWLLRKTEVIQVPDPALGEGRGGRTPERISQHAPIQWVHLQHRRGQAVLEANKVRAQVGHVGPAQELPRGLACAEQGDVRDTRLGSRTCRSEGNPPVAARKVWKAQSPQKMLAATASPAVVAVVCHVCYGA